MSEVVKLVTKKYSSKNVGRLLKIITSMKLYQAVNNQLNICHQAVPTPWNP